MVSAPRPPSAALTWVALLGFALFAPAALPAGGGQRRLPELRRRESPRDPLLNPIACGLLASPRREAPAVAHLEPGLPMRVLSIWWEPSGRRWLRVATPAWAGRPTRGWLMG
ncbi:MAG: SH3 domain-containing protein [Cyanobacteriota bacterium]|jgi:hypothetical protein